MQIQVIFYDSSLNKSFKVHLIIYYFLDYVTSLYATEFFKVLSRMNFKLHLAVKLFHLHI